LYRQQQQQQQHSPLDPYGRPIIIHDTPPLQPSSGSNSKIPEVITISDSDDESPATSVKPTNIAVNTNAPDSKIVTTTASTTTTSTPATNKNIKSTSNQQRSNAPSVMALTPNLIRPEEFGPSTQSTPCASRSHATSCVTVGDSDEENSPIKQEPTTHHSSHPATSLNKKTRLLKAQSEWMLSSLKEEESPLAGASTAAPSRGPSSAYGSHSRLSMVDEKELLQRYSSTSTLRQDYLEQQLMYREDLESRAAAAAAATAAIHDREIAERERDREFALQLGPPMAHQADYTANSRQVAAAIAHPSRAAVEYIQPPVAHSQAAAIAASAAQQQNDVLNVQRAAAAQLAVAAAHHYRQSSPHAASVSSADFCAAAAAAAAAPTTVYVTTAGYQQIAIPPVPPAPPPPAHHSRAVLAPPAAHPLPAHMQPAAAAAAALFPGHPQVAAAASYGYAPLSPGKTRYLY
jgi:homeodomain interacting protein kinase